MRHTLAARQVTNGTPTTYTLDLAAPLVTALVERTFTTTKQYLYGLGDSPLAVYSGTTWTYLSGRDGLNSVRQETDAAGNVLAVRGFDPYGVLLSGNGGAPFGYTGEMYDASTQLVFLRARYMQPGLGVFLSRDPWEGYEQWPETFNGFNYAMDNPIILSDPTGLVPPIPNWPKNGLDQFIECFQLHTVSQYLGDYFYHNQTAQQAVNICRAAYNQAYWNKDLPIVGFNLDTTHLPKTAHDLMGWFVYNKRLDNTNGSDRLWFDANEPLTRQLARGALINEVRNMYYSGENTSGPTEYRYTSPEPVLSTAWYDLPRDILDNLLGGSASLGTSVFVGSFIYQVKTVDSGQRVGFRIDDDTTLASGTHIGGREEPPAKGSLEQLIQRQPGLANRPLRDVLRENPLLVSILQDRKKGSSEGSLGGGDLYQTFTWTERRDCSLSGRMPQDVWAVMLDMKVWSNFRFLTGDPDGWPAQ